MHNFLIPLNWIKVKLEEIGNTSNVAKRSRCELQAKSVYVSQLVKRILYFSPASCK